MDRAYASIAKYVHTLLRLGRVSNLPTVWSNCLAGWCIGQGLHGERLFLLLMGATLFYLAGMFLNDAFDAHYDRQHRPERPIPSGGITLSSVWQWGLSWLALGLLCFGLMGQASLLWAILLASSILLYDAVHKWFALAPLLMGLCRSLLILTAAATTELGVNGYSIWAALVLGLYVAGLSFLAQTESRAHPLAYWACLLLLAPMVLAWVVNRGPYRLAGLLVGLLLILWVWQSLRHMVWWLNLAKLAPTILNRLRRRPGRDFWSFQSNTRAAVSGLLAGIVLVDLLAVGIGSIGLTLVFLCLFVLAVLFQRFIPAT